MTNFLIFTRSIAEEYVSPTVGFRKGVWGREIDILAETSSDALTKFLQIKDSMAIHLKNKDAIMAVSETELDTFVTDKIIVDDSMQDLIDKGIKL